MQKQLSTVFDRDDPDLYLYYERCGTAPKFKTLARFSVVIWVTSLRKIMAKLLYFPAICSPFHVRIRDLEDTVKFMVRREGSIAFIILSTALPSLYSTAGRSFY